MARSTTAPGERPLFWIGSAKSDLLEFPEAVQDEIGVALSVAQFGGKHPKGSHGGVKALGFLKSWRITEAIPTARCIPSSSRALRMCCTRSRRNRRGHKDGADRCRTDFSKAQGGKRGLRGALWQTEKMVMLSFKVRETYLRILVCAMPTRSKHECGWRLPSIRLLRHVACRRLRRRACSRSISLRFPLW
jgi:hypothetical protein